MEAVSTCRTGDSQPIQCHQSQACSAPATLTASARNLQNGKTTAPLRHSTQTKQYRTMKTDRPARARGPFGIKSHVLSPRKHEITGSPECGHIRSTQYQTKTTTPPERNNQPLRGLSPPVRWQQKNKHQFAGRSLQKKQMLIYRCAINI